MGLQSNAFCINPECHREYQSDLIKCPYCGTEKILNDRYRLIKPLRKISQLNPVSVFLGFDEQAQKEVVIKVLDYPEPEYQRHFQNEAAVLGNIRHQGLPIVDIDFGGYFHAPITSSKRHEIECFVMEKIPGETLEDYIEHHGKVSETQAIQWLSELVEIIGALHDKKVFHRDIKPSNIIVRPDETLALIDLGSVRQMTDTYLVKIGAGADAVTKKCDVTLID
jgi:serine/threonine protein kinase